MKAARLPETFVSQAMALALRDEGAFDLLGLWLDETDAKERGEIVADLQDLIDDDLVTPEIKPQIGFKDLERVVTEISEHKAKLRELVEQHGGVSAVARRAGIPQPSLSRMLNSGSMPRRSTLYKIATVLNLSEAQIVGEWVR